MSSNGSKKTPPFDSQLDKFKAAAREAETDDDPDRFRERVGKLVRHKPVEPGPEKAE